MQEGNPVDSAIYSLLILLSVAVLVLRSFDWGRFLSRNAALVLFLSFALLSIFWSDYPFITMKRWIRDLGNYLVMLVALSEAYPLEAVRTVLRRFCYLLIPLSVMLIKYYPQMSISYSAWTGAPEYIGATTSKNMLGVLCLIGGIFFFWDTLIRWSARKESKNKQVMLLNMVMLAMTLWLLHMSASSTSEMCLVLGCLIIVAVHTKWARRHPAVLKVVIPTGMCLYLILAFGFGINVNALAAQIVGKDPTLTGRTLIWQAVLSTGTNPLIGTGYETFWLGPRLAWVWRQTGPGINEAHNGYIDMYLNLGIVGLVLLMTFLAASFRTICHRLDHERSFGSLSLALWTILPFYNVTESAFKGQLIFVIFLLAALVVPQKKKLKSVSPEVPAKQSALPAKVRECSIA